MEYLILFIIILIFLLFIGASQKNKNKTTSEEFREPIKLITVSFPHPEKSDDYVFFKFVQNESNYRLKQIYENIKKEGKILKPQFEEAIKTKLEKGRFINPLDFKETYGSKFDFIGLSFTLGTQSFLSAYELHLGFYKENVVLESETYFIRPPERIIKTKTFQKNSYLIDECGEFVFLNNFLQVWKEEGLQDFFENNLIITWDNEIEILNKLLLHYGFTELQFNSISLKEVAQSNTLPTNIDIIMDLYKLEGFNQEESLAYKLVKTANEMKKKNIKLEKDSDSQKKYSSKTHHFSDFEDQNKEVSFVAIDVETAVGSRWSICQIGLVVVENSEIIQTYSELVKPPNNEYAIGNMRVHQITPENTYDKPFFPEIWKKIFPIIENKKIVAHNAKFDIDCLKQTLNYYNIEIPNFEYDCTLNRTGMKLSEACETFNIELTNHHDAEADALACAKLYLELCSGKLKPKYNTKANNKQKTINKSKGYETLSGAILQKNLDVEDKSNPFYNKKVVFTGVLQNISRTEAAKSIHEMGADINTAISKNTDFVIVGMNPGPSKMKKITKLTNEGCNLRIIAESDFLNMIKK